MSNPKLLHLLTEIAQQTYYSSAVRQRFSIVPEHGAAGEKMKNLTALKKGSKQIRRLKKLAGFCYTKIANVSVSVCKSKEPIEPGRQAALSYTPIAPGGIWAPHVYDCAWFHVTGTVPAEARGKHIVLRMDIDGEGTLYNGTVPVQMITSRSHYVDKLSAESGKCILEIAQEAAGGEVLDLYIDAGYNGINIMAPFGFGYFRGANLAVADDAMIDAFYDYFAAAVLYADLAGEARETAGCALDAAYARLLAGDTAGARKALETVLAGTPADFSFTAIGHSHLDLAWLWPIRETKRKAIRTFTMQLNNLARQPLYFYGASQPWQFEYIRDNHPELFARIRDAVAQGRFEPQGGMYVEADTNLSGGESLIRQIH